MKTLLLKNWNLMRILRLVIGIWAIVEAIQSKEPLLGIMGGILLFMAVTNTGCFGAKGCNTPVKSNKESPEKLEDIRYEEIT